MFFSSIEEINRLTRKVGEEENRLKKKKVQGIFGETFILALSSSASFRLQN